jgi:hypothetical protein
VLALLLLTRDFAVAAAGEWVSADSFELVGRLPALPPVFPLPLRWCCARAPVTANPDTPSGAFSFSSALGMLRSGPLLPFTLWCEDECVFGMLRLCATGVVDSCFRVPVVGGRWAKLVSEWPGGLPPGMTGDSKLRDFALSVDASARLSLELYADLVIGCVGRVGITWTRLSAPDASAVAELLLALVRFGVDCTDEMCLPLELNKLFSKPYAFIAAIPSSRFVLVLSRAAPGPLFIWMDGIPFSES